MNAVRRVVSRCVQRVLWWGGVDTLCVERWYDRLGSQGWRAVG